MRGERVSEIEERETSMETPKTPEAPGKWKQVGVRYPDFQSKAWRCGDDGRVLVVERDLPDPTEEWRVVLMSPAWEARPDDHDRLEVVDSCKDGLMLAVSFMNANPDP